MNQNRKERILKRETFLYATRVWGSFSDIQRKNILDNMGW